MKTKLQILYEDNHILIVNKPAGMLSQNDATGDPALPDIAKKYIKDKYKKPGDVFLHPVHRLDRPASGILVLARTSKARSRLALLFKNREIEKTYIALSRHPPPDESGELVHYLKKDRKKNKTFVQAFPGGESKLSVSEFKLIAQAAEFFVFEIHLITGRPHQIRVQMSAIGCPLAGDVKYGDTQALPDRSIGLHAYRIAFEHPVQMVPLIVTAPFPITSSWDQADRWL